MSLEGMAHKGKYGQQKSHTHHYTVNPLLSPQGANLFQAHLRGGLMEMGGLFETGGLFN